LASALFLNPELFDLASGLQVKSELKSTSDFVFVEYGVDVSHLVADYFSPGGVVCCLCCCPRNRRERLLHDDQPPSMDVTGSVRLLPSSAAGTFKVLTTETKQDPAIFPYCRMLDLLPSFLENFILKTPKFFLKKLNFFLKKSREFLKNI
jgi:hypothetical protein